MSTNANNANNANTLVNAMEVEIEPRDPVDPFAELEPADPPAPAEDDDDDDDSDKEGEESADATTKKERKKRTKIEVECTVKKPEHFPFRQEDTFKLKVFPEGRNITWAFADCRARHAEACDEECGEIAAYYAPTGQWPNNKLYVVAHQAALLRDKADKDLTAAEEQAAKAAAAKLKRAEEKSKIIENLTGSMGAAFAAKFGQLEGEGVDPGQAYAAAKAAAAEIFAKNAPRIKTWAEATIKEAIKAAKAACISEADAEKMLAAAEPEEIKKRVRADEEEPVPKTPASKPASADASPIAPPAPAKKHKKAMVAA